MTEGRCDLILLGWTAFVGFNLISDFLWSNSGHQTHEGSGSNSLAVGLGTASAALFRGDYRLEMNRSLLEEGSVRMTLMSQQTSVESVRISSMSVALLKNPGRSGFSMSQSDLSFSGIAFSDAGKITATGSSDPTWFQLFGERECRVDAVLDLRRGESDALADSKDELDERIIGADGPAAVAADVRALDCGFTVSFAAKRVDVLYMTQKVVHYSIWVNLLTILQIKCFLMQMRHTEDGPSAAKVSLVCIACQALMDAYDSFLHLCLGLSSQYMFNTIAVVSLFKFILFLLLEARYLLTIWRQRRHEAFNQGWDSVRRELSWLYSRFYGALVIGMVVIYNNLERLNYIALTFQAYWLPQILQDAWQGSRSAVHPVFMIGISVTRALLVLYLWGCPQGIFSGDLYPRLPGSPSWKLCAGVVLLQAAQVGVMMLQRVLGPRWFIPRICMPQAYNYFRSVQIDSGTECVICMSEIDPEDARRVVTPCNHKFHRACLTQWMDVKMECPTCRMTLPPIL